MLRRLSWMHEGWQRLVATSKRCRVWLPTAAEMRCVGVEATASGVWSMCGPCDTSPRLVA
jgi:hypothetical protein